MNYLDSNVFIYALIGPSNDKKVISSKNLISSVSKGEVKAITSFLTWDEVVYSIKKHFGLEFSLKEGKNLLNMPNLQFAEVDKNIIFLAQKIMEKYKIKPRDAIHIATALASNINEIISDDKDFDKIKEIKRKGL